MEREVFVRRENAERFIDEARSDEGDEAELAAKMRVEQLELWAV